MKSIMQVFYTHKRTELLLAAKGIKARVMRVTIVRPSGKLYNCVHVVYQVAGSVCSTFLSCKEFLKRAIENRKDASREYYVAAKSNNIYRVCPNSDLTQPGYTVTASPNAIACECLDYQHQESIYKQHPYLWNRWFKQRSICKHGFNLLNHLGFEKLSTYLKAQS